MITEEGFETKEWVYKIKGSKLLVSFVAREKKTVDEMVRLISALVKNPPTKLVEVNTIYVDTPPEVLEQKSLDKYRKKWIEKGLDPFNVN